MAVVEYTYDEIKKYIDLPIEKIVEILNNLGAPTEVDQTIVSEITPNRADWYSLVGLVRSIKIFEGSLKNQYTARKSEYTVIVDEVKERPYTVCAVIKNLKFDDQKIRDIVTLQEKLIWNPGRKAKKYGIGIYPLDKLTFPLKYTTMDKDKIKYTPLGFDSEMSADEIIKNHKKGVQYGDIIKNYKKYPVFIDKNNKIMAMLPIVNSAQSGKIDEKTTEVFVEVSGVDKEAISAALNVICCALADIGGQIYQVTHKYKEEEIYPNLTEKKFKLNSFEIEKVVGINFSEKELEKYLLKMGYGFNKGEILVPPYRSDIISNIDIIEDIIIAFGFNNFEPTLPDFFSAGKKNTKFDYLRQILTGMGFLEIKTFSLTNKQKLDEIGFNGNYEEISNPLGEEYTILRPSAIGEMLEVISINKMKKIPQKYFETALVHENDKTKEKIVISIVNQKIEFSEIRGYLQTLFYELDKKFDLEKTKIEVFEDNSCIIKINNKNCGKIGKVKKEICEKKGIVNEVYICEFEI